MAEIAPPTVTATPVATPPAAATPPVVLGAPALSLADAAAKVRAGNKVETGAPAPAAAPAVVPPPAIKQEGANLADLTRLSAENRKLTARVQELEPHAKDAALLKEVRDLYAGGHKVAAIGKLAGADPTQEMEALLADYLKDPSNPEVQDKLSAKVEEVAKRIDEGEKTRQQAAEQADQAKAASDVVGSHLEAQAAKLPHTAKADRAEAIGKVKSLVTKLAHERGLADQAAIAGAPPEVIRSILEDAIVEVEIEYEVRAARAARVAVPAAVPTPAVAVAPPPFAAPAPAEPVAAPEGLSRPGMQVQEWGKATLTPDQAKAKAKAFARQGQ